MSIAHHTDQTLTQACKKRAISHFTNPLPHIGTATTRACREAMSRTPSVLLLKLDASMMPSVVTTTKPGVGSGASHRTRGRRDLGRSRRISQRGSNPAPTDNGVLRRLRTVANRAAAVQARHHDPRIAPRDAGTAIGRQSSSATWHGSYHGVRAATSGRSHRSRPR